METPGREREREKHKAFEALGNPPGGGGGYMGAKLNTFN